MAASRFRRTYATSRFRTKNETLRDYIERFTREGVEVYGASDKLKWFIL